MSSIRNNIILGVSVLFLSCNQTDSIPAGKSDSLLAPKQPQKEGYIMPGMDHGCQS